MASVDVGASSIAPRPSTLGSIVGTSYGRDSRPADRRNSVQQNSFKYLLERAVRDRQKPTDRELHNINGGDLFTKKWIFRAVLNFFAHYGEYFTKLMDDKTYDLFARRLTNIRKHQKAARELLSLFVLLLCKQQKVCLVCEEGAEEFRELSHEEQFTHTRNHIEYLAGLLPPPDDDKFTKPDSEGCGGILLDMLPRVKALRLLRTMVADMMNVAMPLDEGVEYFHSFTVAPKKLAAGEKPLPKPRFCWDTADESLISSPLLNRLSIKEPHDRDLIMFLADINKRFPAGPSKGKWVPTKGREGLATNWKEMDDANFARHLKQFVNCCFPPAVTTTEVKHPAFQWPTISRHYIFLWTMDTRGTLILNTLENLIRFLHAFASTLHTVYFDAHEDELGLRSGKEGDETKGPRWQIDPAYTENNFQSAHNFGETAELGWDQLVPLVIQVVTYLRCVGFAYEAHLVSEIFLKMEFPIEKYDPNFRTERAYALPEKSTGFNWTWDQRIVPRSQFEVLTTTYGMKESDLEKFMDEWSPNKRKTTAGKEVEAKNAEAERIRQERGIQQAFEARPEAPEVPPIPLVESSDPEEGSSSEGQTSDEESVISTKRKRDPEHAGSVSGNNGDRGSENEVEHESQEATTQMPMAKRSRTGAGSFSVVIEDPAHQTDVEDSSEDDSPTPIRRSVPRASATAKPDLQLDTSVAVTSDGLSSGNITPTAGALNMDAEDQESEEEEDEVPITSSPVVSSSPASRYEEVPPLPVEEQITSSAIKRRADEFVQKVEDRKRSNNKPRTQLDDLSDFYNRKMGYTR